MIRPVNRLSLPRTLAAAVLLTGVAASAPLRAQSVGVAATPNPAIFHDTAASVVFTGNLRHYAGDDGGMSHGFLALVLAPSGKVTGTLTWHGTKVDVPLVGKLDVGTGQGHFTQRDADGKKLADAVRIPFLVNRSGLTLNGGGMENNGDSTSFLLNRRSDSSTSYYGGEGGATLTVGGATLTTGGANFYTGSSLVSTGVVGSYGSFTSVTGASTINGGSYTISGGTTATNWSGAALTGTVTLAPTYAGTLTLPPTFAGNVVVTTGTSLVLDADGDLTYNGSVILHAPITTTTNTSGATVYTGTDASGASMTVTVIPGSTSATGG